jgi:perosamine synthetase
MELYQKLEADFAAFTGRSYASTTNTGTAALHLALAALDIGPGDEVLVPDFTMIACAYAVVYTGAKPVFVPVNDRLLMDTEKLESYISPYTKAIMPVHIYGRVCEMQKINRIAKKHCLYVIEDASEAHGAKLGPSDVACFSFFKNKIIHGEEGGIAVTDNQALWAKMQLMKNMAFTPTHDYTHEGLGFNYRLANSQAALILDSLEKYPQNAAQRRLIESWYDKYLPQEWQMPPREAVWFYDLKHPRPYEVVKTIPTARHWFKSLSGQPLFGQKPLAYPTGVLLSAREDLTEAEVKQTCQLLLDL